MKKSSENKIGMAREMSLKNKIRKLMARILICVMVFDAKSLSNIGVVYASEIKYISENNNQSGKYFYGSTNSEVSDDEISENEISENEISENEIDISSESETELIDDENDIYEEESETDEYDFASESETDEYDFASESETDENNIVSDGDVDFNDEDKDTASESETDEYDFASESETDEYDIMGESDEIGASSTNVNNILFGVEGDWSAGLEFEMDVSAETNWSLYEENGSYMIKRFVRSKINGEYKTYFELSSGTKLYKTFAELNNSVRYADSRWNCVTNIEGWYVGDIKYVDADGKILVPMTAEYWNNNKKLNAKYALKEVILDTNGGSPDTIPSLYIKIISILSLNVLQNDQVTLFTNLETLPEKTSCTFDGFWKDGVQYIDAQGYKTANWGATTFENLRGPITLIASYSTPIASESEVEGDWSDGLEFKMKIRNDFGGYIYMPNGHRSMDFLIRKKINDEYKIYFELSNGEEFYITFEELNKSARYADTRWNRVTNIEGWYVGDIKYVDADGNILVPQTAEYWNNSKTLTVKWALKEVILDTNGGSPDTIPSLYIKIISYEELKVLQNDQVTPFTNLETLPEKTSCTFDGFWKDGVQYIDAQGYKTANWGATTFENLRGPITLIASYSTPIASESEIETNIYEITLDKQIGSGGTNKIYEVYGTGYSFYPTGEPLTTEKINRPARWGCIFDGYYEFENGQGKKYIDKDGNVCAELLENEGNITIYANWIYEKQGEYILDNQGGSGEDILYLIEVSETTHAEDVKKHYTFDLAEKTYIDDMIPVSNLPTKFGYIFDGYFSLPNGGGEKYIDANGAILKEIPIGATIYAKWVSDGQKYEIILDNKGNYGGSDTVVGGLTKIYIVFEKGFTLSADSETFITQIPADSLPTLNYKTFAGYYNGNVLCIDKDGTILMEANNYAAQLTANWVSAGFYQIMFDKNEGTGGTDNVYVKAGIYSSPYGFKDDENEPFLSKQEFVIEIPKRFGYTFKGYYGAKGDIEKYTYIDENGKFTVEGLIFTANMTLYAEWEPNIYKIQICDQNGSLIDNKDIYLLYSKGYTFNNDGTNLLENNKIPTPSLPTKPGYKFDGYYEKPNGEGKQFVKSDGTIVYDISPSEEPSYICENWIPLIYTITLDNRDNTKKQIYEVYKEGVSYNLSGTPFIEGKISKPSWYGRIFQGYYEEPDGKGIQYIDADGEFISDHLVNIVGDTTIYAYWKYDIAEIKIDNTPGSGPSKLYRVCDYDRSTNSAKFYYSFNSDLSELYYDKMPVSSLPTRQGYKFAGYEEPYFQVYAGKIFINSNGEIDKSLLDNLSNSYGLKAKWVPDGLKYEITIDNKGDYKGNKAVVGGLEKLYFVYEKGFTLSADGENYITKIATSSFPTIEHQKFLGYFDGSKQCIDQDGNILMSNVKYINKLSGKWGSVDYYTITFDKDGGSGGTDKIYAKSGNHQECYSTTEDGTFKAPQDFTIEIPQKYGFTFKGYYNPVGEGDYYFEDFYTNAEGRFIKGSQNIKADTILFAKWEPNIYKIDTKNKQGGITSSLYLVYSKGFTFKSDGTNLFDNNNIPTPSLPTKPGYIFDGYYEKANGEGIKFVKEDGTILLSTTPTENEITAHKIIYEYWTPLTYEITLDEQYGYGVHKKLYETCGEGVKANPNDEVYISNISIAARWGRIFKGFYENPDGTGIKYIDEDGKILDTIKNNVGDRTIYAYWAYEKFVVDLDNQGGDGKDKLYIVYENNSAGLVGGVYYYSLDQDLDNLYTDNKIPTPSLPVRSGYIFDGFYEKQKGVGEKYIDANGTIIKVPPVNHKIYANWLFTPYKITLDYQDGTTAGTLYEVYNEGVSYDASGYPLVIANKISKPSWYGRIFQGYYEEPDGKGIQYIDADGKAKSQLISNVGDRTIYAYWKYNVTEVKLYNNDGSGPSNLYMICDYDRNTSLWKFYCSFSATLDDLYEDIVPMSSLPTKQGYKFDGYKDKWNHHFGQIFIASNGEINKTVLKELQSYNEFEALWVPDGLKYEITIDNKGDYKGNKAVVGGLEKLYFVYEKGFTLSAEGENYITKISTSSFPTIEHQKFLGYFDGSKQCIDQDGNILMSNVKYINKLSGKWGSIDYYTITFDKDGGSGGTDKIYAKSGNNIACYSTTEDGTFKAPQDFTIEIPQKYGFTFKGYYNPVGEGDYYFEDFYTNAEGKFIKGSQNIKADTILFAKWEPNKYTIKLTNSGLGTSMFLDLLYSKEFSLTKGNKTDVLENNKISTQSLPTWAGYTFDGYYTQQNGKGVKVIEKDGTILLSTSPSQEELNSMSTVYSNWIPLTYEIILDNQEGSKDVLYEIYKKSFSKNLSGTPSIADNSVNKPSWYGRIFQGYYENPDGTGIKYIDEDGKILDTLKNNVGDRTIYAYWKYDITEFNLNNNNGTGPSKLYRVCDYDKSINSSKFYYSFNSDLSDLYYDKMPVLSLPTRQGYKFAGYEEPYSQVYAGKIFINSNGEIDKSLLDNLSNSYGLKAKWAPLIYAITLKDNFNEDRTATIYEIYKTGYSLNPSGEPLISDNRITWLDWNYGIFQGYCDDKDAQGNGTGTYYIASSGIISNDLKNNIGDKTLYKSWKWHVSPLILPQLELSIYRTYWGWTLYEDGTHIITDSEQYIGDHIKNMMMDLKITGWYSPNTNVRFISGAGSIKVSSKEEWGDISYLVPYYQDSKYTITLDNGLGTPNIATIYQIFDRGLSWDGEINNIVNKFSQDKLPIRPGYTFGGYYSERDGKGNCFIKADGSVVESLVMVEVFEKLYANYIPNKYKISLNNGSGSTGGLSEIYEVYDKGYSYDADGDNMISNKIISSDKLPRLEGYKFIGYYDAPVDGNLCVRADGTILKGNTDYTDNTKILYARYTKIVTVNLISTGSNGYPKKLYHNAGAFTDTNCEYLFEQLDGVPQKDHHTFDGFYLNGVQYIDGDGNKTTNWTSSVFSSATNDINLYAEYIPDKYKIILMNGDGNGSLTSIYEVYGKGYSYNEDGSNIISNNKIPIDKLPTKQGHKFIGYYDAEIGGNICIKADGTISKENTYFTDGNAQIYAVYTANIIVNLISTGSNGYPKKLYHNGGVYTDDKCTTSFNQLTIPQREYHTFDGFCLNGIKYINNSGYKTTNWTDNVFDSVSGEVYLYAEYIPNKYKISFNNGSGSTGGVSEIYEVYGVGFSYDSNGNNIISNNKISADKLPVKLGHAFNGYYDSQTGGNLCIKADGTILKANTDYTDNTKTLYATYIKNVRKVILDDATNGMTGGSGVIYKKLGAGFFREEACSNPIVSVNIPYGDDAIFKGYYSSSSGGTLYIDENGNIKTEVFDDSVITDDEITIYAQTREIKYKLIYKKVASDANWQGVTPSASGNVEVKVSETDDNPLLLSADNLVRTNYKLVGWKTDAGEIYDCNSVASSTFTGNVTLTAIWLKLSGGYIVKFDSNYDGAPAIDSRTYTNYPITGETLLPQPTRSGYIFAGWCYKSDCSGTPISKEKEVNAKYVNESTNTITLYANWSESINKLSFNMHGHGAQIPQQTLVGIQHPSRPATPSVTGYIFDGWYTDSTYATLYNFDHILIQNETAHAKWSQVNKIVLKLNDGTNNIYNTYYYKEKTGLFIDADCKNVIDDSLKPDRTGYVFKGFYESASGNSKKYINDDGTMNVSVWNNSGFIYNTTITIYACWEAIKYTFKFDMDGANIATPSDETKHYNTNLTLPTFTNLPTGYIFEGWWTTSASPVKYTGTSDLTEIAGTVIILKAKWKYKVTYYNNGHGIVPAALTVEKNDIISLSQIEQVTGYTHDGKWYSESGGTNYVADMGATYIVTNPLNLYVKWDENEYDIILHENEGVYVSGYTAPNKRKYSEGITLPDNTKIKKTGYKHSGWYENSGYTGNPVTAVAAKTVGDKEYYLRWDEQEYSITYVLNGGNWTTELTASNTKRKYTESKTLLTLVERYGFIFKGWYETNTGSGSPITEVPANTEGDKKFFAIWELDPNYLLVSFDSKGGSTIQDVAVASGNTIDKPSDPTRSGYTFDGWYIDEALQQSFSFSTTITSAITLYAKWQTQSTQTSTSYRSGNYGGSGASIGGAQSGLKPSLNPADQPSVTWSSNAGPATNKAIKEYENVSIINNQNGSISIRDKDGNPIEGFCKIKDANGNSNVYYFTENNVLYTGWVCDEQGNLYHFDDANGSMNSGSMMIGNQHYTFDENGMYNGNIEFLPDGKVIMLALQQDNFVYDPINNTWGCVRKTVDGFVGGVYANGIYEIEVNGSKKVFCFDESGRMMTGMFEYNGKVLCTSNEGDIIGELGSDNKIVNSQIEPTAEMQKTMAISTTEYKQTVIKKVIDNLYKNLQSLIPK